MLWREFPIWNIQLLAAELKHTPDSTADHRREPKYRVNMELEQLYQGKMKTVAFLVLDDGSCPAQDFLRSLDSTQKGLEGSMRNRIKGIIDHWPPRNPDAFKRLKNHGNIYEFKRKPARIMCFSLGRIIVLTHGFIKRGSSSSKKDKQQYAKTKRFAEQYEKSTNGEA